jgi:hypothetical protein
VSLPAPAAFRPSHSLYSVLRTVRLPGIFLRIHHQMPQISRVLYHLPPKPRPEKSFQGFVMASSDGNLLTFLVPVARMVLVQNSGRRKYLFAESMLEATPRSSASATKERFHTPLKPLAFMAFGFGLSVHNICTTVHNCAYLS